MATMSKHDLYRVSNRPLHPRQNISSDSVEHPYYVTYLDERPLNHKMFYPIGEALFAQVARQMVRECRQLALYRARRHVYADGMPS